MADATSAKTTIFFIHNLWLHQDSWNHWIRFFREKGYEATAASWPEDATTLQATPGKAKALADYDAGEIVDHIAAQLEAFGRKAIVIGHSFGGLLVQNVLGRNLAAAGIAIDPTPFVGASEPPFSALRSVFSMLDNPFNGNRAVPLTEEAFRFAFANVVLEQEAKDLYETYAMPNPGRPLFQVATGMLNSHAATEVQVANETRGPLLLIAGEKDNTVPPILVQSALRLYNKHSSAVTEYKEFPDRGHSLVLDNGWREIAEYTLTWLQSKGFQSNRMLA